MRFARTVVLALLLLVVESVVVHQLGLRLARIDVVVVLVVFLSLRASLVEGALSAFAAGYLMDVMSGPPTGLYVFLSVLTFLVVRLVVLVVEVRGAPMFVVVVAAADAAVGLLAAFFHWLTSDSGFHAATLSGLPATVALTAVAALALWPLLRRLDPGGERPEVGALQ